MSKVLIRQIADDYSEATGLAKYNRSRMPGCKDQFAVAPNTDGRYLTGLDEESYLVRDASEKERIKSLRESLEKKVGKDLSGTSEFWESFKVIIDADNPKIFDTENPMDLISLTTLIANKNVAPTKEDISNPTYKDAQYYAYTEEGEQEEKVVTRKVRDKALAELYNIGEDESKMRLYGQYLEGAKYSSEKLNKDTLYQMLRAYIEEGKDTKQAKNFLEVLKIPVEEIQQKVIIDNAVRRTLIKKVKTGMKTFTYQYGQVTLGNNLEEVYLNLSLPNFAPELLSIKKELER